MSLAINCAALPACSSSEPWQRGGPILPPIATWIRAYRIGLEVPGPPNYLELHDEIADLDAMITQPSSTSSRRISSPANFDWPRLEPPSFFLRPATIPKDCDRKASCASLCGVSPVPASSGKTVRHRLNRGGDRAANSALHYRHRTSTNRPPGLQVDYVARRIAEGHSKLDAIRALKRYLAKRGLYAHHSAPQRDQRHANCRLTNRRASEGRSMRPRCIASCWPHMAWRDR